MKQTLASREGGRKEGRGGGVALKSVWWPPKIQLAAAKLMIGPLKLTTFSSAWSSRAACCRVHLFLAERRWLSVAAAETFLLGCFQEYSRKLNNCSPLSLHHIGCWTCSRVFPESRRAAGTYWRQTTKTNKQTNKAKPKQTVKQTKIRNRMASPLPSAEINIQKSWQAGGFCGGVSNTATYPCVKPGWRAFSWTFILTCDYKSELDSLAHWLAEPWQSVRNKRCPA